MARILVLAAHPDDEAYGMGGTIAKFADQGDEISIMFFADGDSSRLNSKKHVDSDKVTWASKAIRILGAKHCRFMQLKDQQLDTYPILDLIHEIEGWVKVFKPQYVFTHNINDLNKDHRIVAEATMVACRPVKDCSVKTLAMYEIPSSSEWYPDKEFIPNWFIDISKYEKQKWEAIFCYKNELESPPHPRSTEMMMNKMKLNGSRSGLDLSEAFRIIRSVE